MAPLALTRRSLLLGAAAVAGAGHLAGCSGPSARPLAQAPAFDRPLAVPPLDRGRLGPDGVRTFELTARAGTSDFGTSGRTPTWGYNGAYLGPTLRARVGEEVRVVVRNDLDVTTTVHWHGMHLPAEYDGGPHQPIHAGASWEPRWRIDQEPATLWYHPHPHGDTEEHVYRGLAGVFLIDAADGDDSRLPSTYGVDDVPLVVQDKRLADDGELVFDDGGNEIGLLGNRVLANGTYGAFLDVTTRLLRLRLLNGSTARSYRFELSDGRPFHQVGTDGGLLERPRSTRALPLSPGERAEIVVALRPGETVRLTSTGADLGDVVAVGAFGGNDRVDVLELRAAARLTGPSALPARLPGAGPVTGTVAATSRSFVLEGRDINGRQMDLQRIDETVVVGTTEVWEVRSKNLFPHNFHVHDVQFQVLDVDGEEPAPHLRGRKDVVYLEPLRTYRLLMSFADHASTRWPYMYHCHLLLHEDDGMMGQFLVLEPGASPASTIGAGGSGHH